MSDQFSERELRALFQKNLPNDPMPPGLAASLEQQVLAEVASVLRPDAVYSSALESEVEPQTELARQPLARRTVRKDVQPSFLARIFGQRPSFQFGPSFAMMGAAAALLIVLFNFGAGPLGDLFTPPPTGGPGGLSSVEVVPTAEATNTLESVVTADIEPSPTPESEAVFEETTAEIVVEPTAVEPAVDPIEPTVAPPEAVATESEEISDLENNNVIPNENNDSTIDDTDISELSSTNTNSTDTDVTTATTSNDSNIDDVVNDQLTDVGPTVVLRSETADTSAARTAQVVAQANATNTPIPTSAQATFIPAAPIMAESTSTTPTIMATSTPIALPIETPTTRSVAVTSATQTDQPESTDIATQTPTDTRTPTITATNTPKPTDTRTRTSAPTFTETHTATAIPPTATATAITLSTQSSATAIQPSSTPLPTKTSTGTPISTLTNVPANTNTLVPTETRTSTPIPTETLVPTDTDTPVPTETSAPTDTNTPIPTETHTSTPIPTETNTNTPVPTETLVPTDTNTPIPPTATNTNTAVPPTATNTAVPEVANQRPQIVDDVVTIEEDGEASVNVLANDFDVDGDTLQITNVGQPANGTVTYDATGQVIYVPAENYSGEDAFTYEVSDGNGPGVVGFVRIAIIGVNDAPTVANSTFLLIEDSGAQSISVLENVYDVEGDPVTLVEALGTEHGTVSVADNMLLYTPNADFNGTDTIVYRVADSSQAVATGTIIVEVSPVNDAPIARADSIEAVEDMTSVLAVLDNDIDVDAGDSISILEISGSIAGDLRIINNGTAIEYTPSKDFFGAGVFTYTVTDGKSTASASVNVTVLAVNDPTTVNDDSAITEEDTPISIAPLANDTDIDTDITALRITSITNVQNGTVTEANGVVQFSPNKDYNGIGGFSYTVSDGEFDVAGNVVITIMAVNDAPLLLSNNVYTLTAGSDISIAILAPTLVGDVDGDTLTATIVTPPNHAEAVSIADSAAGVSTLYYKSALDYSGLDSLAYEVNDGQGGMLMVTQQFVITAKPNQPPVVPERGIVTLDEDVSAELNLLNGVIDPDGDVLTIVSFDQTTANGVIAAAEESSVIYKYTPNANYNGVDMFNYTISDGEYSVQATINIQVNPVADKPAFTTQPEPATLTVQQGADYSYNFEVFDADGDSISVKLSEPAPEWLGVTGSSQLFGTAGPMDVGEHSIILEATDSSGDKATQEFIIVVTNVNDAPTNLTLDLNENESNPEVGITIFDLRFEDLDVADSHTISVTLSSPGLLRLIDTDPNDRFAKLQVELEAGVSTVSPLIRVTDSAGAIIEKGFSFGVTPLPLPEITATSIPTATVVLTTTATPTSTITAPDVSASSVPVTITVPITTTGDITVTIPITGTGE